MNAFRRAGGYLGIGIVNLLHLFNPRMVVLGGSVTKAGPLLFDPMHEAINAKALPFYWKDWPSSRRRWATTWACSARRRWPSPRAAARHRL